MTVSRSQVTGFAKGFAVTVLAAAVVLMGWLAVTGVRAKALVDDIDRAARAAAAHAQAGDFAGAADELPGMAEDASQLSGILQAAPWSWAAGLPVVGSAVGSVATISEATDRTLGPLAADPDTRSAAATLSARDGSVEALSALESLSPTLERTLAASADGGVRVAAIRPQDVVSPLAGTVAQAQERYLALADGLEASVGAANALPTVLGLHGTRRWLVILQNPAEARGTGGLIGAYALAKVRDGRIQATMSDTNNSLRPGRISLAGIPRDTRRLWGSDDLAWMWGLNLDRHFPFAAQLAQRTLPAGSGRVDEVLSLDPVAVAALLAVTGPVRAEGVRIDARTAADFLTREVYAQFRKPGRKDEVVAALLNKTLHELAEDRVELAGVLNALGPLAGDQRVLLYSNHDAVQRELTQMPTSGVVPTKPGPWATVAINDYAGSKMDAYLDSAVTYRPGTMCPAPGEQSSITVTVTNTAPKGLRAYGSGRSDRFGRGRDSTLIDVGVYGPVGARPVRFDVDGSPGAAVPGRSRSHPVWRRTLDLQRGETRTFTAVFDEPYRPDLRPMLQAQPMVRPTTTAIEEPACP